MKRSLPLDLFPFQPNNHNKKTPPPPTTGSPKTFDKLWSDLRNITADMFLAGSNAANCNLKHSGWRCGEFAYSPGDWELFGIDYMFDADFKPWVLEVRFESLSTFLSERERAKKGQKTFNSLERKRAGERRRPLEFRCVPLSGGSLARSRSFFLASKRRAALLA